MSYETEEQQVERLKEWWSDNGTPLIVGAILGLAGFGGWKYWNNQQVVDQMGASDLYNKVTEVLKTQDKSSLAESAQAVKDQFPRTSYAILSAFHLAKLAVEANELDKAAAELTWIVDNHSDNELANVAKIRLARVLIEQGKASEALQLASIDEDSGYYALANLVKGDALVTLGRKDEALQAYKLAIADASIAARNPTLQLKIDDLSYSKEQAGSEDAAGSEDVAESEEKPASEDLSGNEEKPVSDEQSENKAQSDKDKPAPGGAE